MVPKKNMAKLQKQVSRKIGDKKYSKYVIVIPESEIKKAGFKEGETLEIKNKNGKIIISKS